jgi:inhibitor of KinA
VRSFPSSRCVGDNAILVEFGDEVAPEINDRVIALDRALQDAPLIGVVDCAPAYASLLVKYDPLITDPDALIPSLDALLNRLEAITPSPRQICVPVCYDPPFSPDLAHVCERTGLEEEEVIAAHLVSALRVYMFGFTPGCAYMGGLAPAIRLPRRATPVQDVPAGSVIIAGQQCIVTTFTMPTGWWIIGRSPAKIFDPDGQDAFYFRIGDVVRFSRIDASALERSRA